MAFKHFNTSLAKENEYPKLVRDKIPEIVEKITSTKVQMRILEDDEEYLQYLLKKIEEEAHELAHAKNDGHIIEEIADVMELIDTILDFKALDINMVRNAQKDKAKKRGGFKKRVLMLEKVKE